MPCDTVLANGKLIEVFRALGELFQKSQSTLLFLIFIPGQKNITVEVVTLWAEVMGVGDQSTCWQWLDRKTGQAQVPEGISSQKHKTLCAAKPIPDGCSLRTEFFSNTTRHDKKQFCMCLCWSTKSVPGIRSLVFILCFLDIRHLFLMPIHFIFIATPAGKCHDGSFYKRRIRCSERLKKFPKDTQLLYQIPKSILFPLYNTAHIYCYCFLNFILNIFMMRYLKNIENYRG